MAFGYRVVRESDAKKKDEKYAGMEKNYHFVMDEVLKGNAASRRNVKDTHYWQPDYKPPIDQMLVPVSSYGMQPAVPFNRMFLYTIEKTVDAVRIPIEVKNREILRNGFEIKATYQYKCHVCGKDWQTKPTSEMSSPGATDNPDMTVECDICGNQDLQEPDPAHRKILSKLLKEAVNNNGQRMTDLFAEVERDLEVADDAYLLVRKDYNIEDNEIKGAEVVEMQTIFPPHVALICNTTGKLGTAPGGGEVFICPIHREKPMVVGAKTRANFKYSKKGTPKCGVCGCESIKAIVEVSNTYAPLSANQGRILFGMGEVIFSTGKYYKGRTFGYSEIYTVYDKAVSMRSMDSYIKAYFDRQRPPQGLLVIGSRNYESLKAAMSQMKDEAQEDPYALHTLMVESERGGRNMVQFIDITGSLKEMDYIQVRNEFRRTIGAAYGILPLFGGDIPQGWSQESLEMTVTNRAVDHDQKYLRDNFLIPMCQLFGVDDWYIDLKTGEETDDLRDAQYQKQEIDNMLSMASAGYLHHLNGDGDFVYSQYPQMMAAPDGTGGHSQMNMENMTNHDGEHLQKRPSDTGGQSAGSPASGPNTSASKKAMVPQRYVRLAKAKRRKSNV